MTASLLWIAAMLPAFAPQNQPPGVGQRVARGFLYKTLTLEGVPYAYSVYVPPQYTPTQAWPVILFLHGSGERGTDGISQTATGLPAAIRRHPQRCPAIVVMPQCRPNRWWDEQMLTLAVRCLEQTSREYHLDPQRIYLTGLSMGGAGVWELAARYPDRFAAIAPVAGFVGRPDQPPDPTLVQRLAERVARLPVWCAHGARDRHVRPEHSRAMVEALRRHGASVRYAEYPAVGHNAWDRFYADPAFWRWLFRQRRGAAPTPSSRP